MAARPLLLLVVMLVFAALYGCAQVEVISTDVRRR